MKRLSTLVFLGFTTFGLYSQAAFPLTVKDAWGAVLTLNAAPRAVVSLTLPTDEILVELIDPSRFAAMDVFATDPGISNIADRAQKFPVKISAEKEKVVALRPDLVLVADWKEKEFVEALRDAQLRVFVVRTPDSIASMKSVVTLLATLMGEPEKGKALIDQIDRRLTAVTVKVANVPANQRPTVFSYSFYGSTYGSGTSFDGLVAAAGLVNAAAKAGLSGWPEVSKEKLLELDPDLIVLPTWSYDGKDDPKRFLADFLKDPVLQHLKAVKNGKVLVLADRHMQATSQYMVDGVEDLARAAYPERLR